MNTESYLNYIDDLNQSYREVYDKVVQYVSLLDGLSEEHKNEKLNDLLDVMLSAQADGRPVEKICGRDVRAFCREFCAEYDIRFGIFEVLRNCRFEIWLLLIDCLFWMFGWFVDDTVRQGSSLIGLVIQDQTNNYILTIVFMGFVSAVASALERHWMFEQKSLGEIVMRGIRAASIIAGFVVLILTFMNVIGGIRIPLGILLPFCLIWLGVSYWLESTLRGDVDDRPLTVFGKTLKNEIPREIDEQFPIAMEKKYCNLRDRKQRKGIAYSMEDFLKDEEQETLRLLKLRKFFMFLPVIMSAMILLVESAIIADEPAVVFGCAAVTFLIECIIMFLLWKAIKGVAVQRIAWIRGKREGLK